MKAIELTQGKVALVDDADYEELNKHKWHVKFDKTPGKCYASRNIPGPDGKQTCLKMHRAIMKPEQGFQVDHRNNKGLHNYRNNLRICTNTENCRNAKINRLNTSGYKGVGRKNNKWRARIIVNRKEIFLGSFFCLIKAAKAYDKAAREYFGEFAQCNFT